jgi:hypothetical protein
MSLTPYSSVSAFVAHCRVLHEGGEGGTGRRDAAARPSLPDSPTLDEIEPLLAEMSEAERDALGLAQPPKDATMDAPLAAEGMPAAAGQHSDAASRRSARAALKLRRVLAAHGLLIS